MSNNIEGKVVVITGASSGPGEATRSRRFGKETSSGLRRVKNTGMEPPRTVRWRTSQSRKSLMARGSSGWKRSATHSIARRSVLKLKQRRPRRRFGREANSNRLSKQERHSDRACRLSGQEYGDGNRRLHLQTSRVEQQQEVSVHRRDTSFG